MNPNMAGVDVRYMINQHLHQIWLPGNVQEPYLKSVANWIRRDAAWKTIVGPSVYQAEIDGLNIIADPLLLRICPEPVMTFTQFFLIWAKLELTFFFSLQKIRWNVWRITGTSYFRTSEPGYMIVLWSAEGTRIEGGPELRFGSVTYVDRLILIHGQLDYMAIFPVCKCRLNPVTITIMFWC